MRTCRGFDRQAFGLHDIPVTRFSRNGDYMLSLSRAGFDTLEERREQLTERFFRRSVLPETSCLHYPAPV